MEHADADAEAVRRRHEADTPRVVEEKVDAYHNQTLGSRRVRGGAVRRRAETNQDIAVAQARKPIMMTRIFTGPDGLSRAEQVEMKLNGNVTEMMKATGVEFSRRAPGPASDWHVGPRRQFVITLSGRGELVLGTGRRWPPVRVRSI